MTISVIICTYNRSESLRMALNSLEEMLVPAEVSWELIVVDNNSNDETREVISEFVRRGTLPLRYIFERRQGKSFALNTGIMETKGEIVAFTDDDCLVDVHWGTAIAKEFAADPSLVGIGGRVELFDKNDEPITIRTGKERITFSSLSFDRLFAFIVGCNMAFRRKVFNAVGGFDPDFGPGSKMGAVSDDPEFVYRAYKGGFKMVYSPDVLVYHNHGRRADAQIKALNRGYAIGRGAFYSKYILRGDRDILKMAYWEICWLTKGLVKNCVSERRLGQQGVLLLGILTGALRYTLSRPFAYRQWSTTTARV